MKFISSIAAVLVLSTVAAASCFAQFGPAPDVEFNPVGLAKQMVPSQACVGFWKQPGFKCWPVQVPVYMAHAKTGGDNKAVVFITHGSGGLDKRHSDYAHYLAANGITAVAMGHWEARGVGKIHFDYNKARTQGADAFNQAIDALAIAGSFKQRPEYATAKFGFLGESMGGTVAMNIARPYMYEIVHEVTGLPKKELFVASVGLYAGCVDQNTAENFKPIPTLLITGEKDSKTPVANCQQQVTWMNSRGGAAEPVMVLPGEHHDFDAPWRIHYNPTAENASKCRAVSDKGQYTLVQGGKTFPASFDGLQELRRECMGKGVFNGNNGNPKMGYDRWLAFFQNKLLVQPSR